ncbi:MAG: ATP-binding cassette domain-containing protein, partial [Candidatus Poribacteria bacterium]|nr:ATP-binding cassette domain-containing protein [Candidatus Poribacteria bacterium]
MTNEILVVKKLNTFYPLEFEKDQKKLLDNINLLVQQNDVLGLVGETGAGKSILIDSIGRNLEPPLWSDAETLSIHLDSKSENLLEKGADELRNIWGNGIAFIPPNARERLNPIMNVGQQVSNVIQSNSNLSRKESDKKVVEIFEMVKMPDPENNFFSFPHELSGGMAQRVIISVALSMSPKLLLADEPTMGLDVTIQAQVLDLMAELLKEKFEAAAILATRDLGIV